MKKPTLIHEIKEETKVLEEPDALKLENAVLKAQLLQGQLSVMRMEIESEAARIFDKYKLSREDWGIDAVKRLFIRLKKVN